MYLKPLLVEHQNRGQPAVDICSAKFCLANQCKQWHGIFLTYFFMTLLINWFFFFFFFFCTGQHQSMSVSHLVITWHNVVKPACAIMYDLTHYIKEESVKVNTTFGDHWNANL